MDSLGIPFSDPTAEGPVIQGANPRALQGGVTTDKIFDFVRELRKDVVIQGANLRAVQGGVTTDNLSARM